MNLVQSSFAKLFNDKLYMFAFYLSGTLVFGTLARSFVLHGMTPYHAAWLVCVLVVPFNLVLYSSYYWILALIVPHEPITEEQLLSDKEFMLGLLHSEKAEFQIKQAELTQILLLRTSLLKEKQERTIRQLEMLMLLLIGIESAIFALFGERSISFLLTLAAVLGASILAVHTLWMIWTHAYDTETRKVLDQFKDLLTKRQQG